MLTTTVISLLTTLPLLVSACGPPSEYVPRARAKRQTSSQYPAEDVPGPAPLQAWVDTYNTAKAAGKIPGFAPARLVNGNPNYGSANTGADGACSWTAAHCYGAYDIVDGPANTVGVAFDDGPQLASPPLYNFLQKNNQKATHFMIGSRILDNPAIFKQAVDTGGHIAVHTWSHPYMTTMTDMQVLGELGWTMKIIHDQTGLIPAFWRPPYGDVDNRVRAIASEVFGLATVIWNHDTFDWCLSEGGGSSCSTDGPSSDAALDQTLQGLWNGPKSPGLLVLEHELTSRSVGGFVRNYPTLISQGWRAQAIPDLWSADWYQTGTTVGAGRSNAIGKSSNSTSSSVIPSPASSSSVVLPSSSAVTSSASSRPTTSARSTSSTGGSRISASSSSPIVAASGSAPSQVAAQSTRTGAASSIKVSGGLMALVAVVAFFA